MPKKKKTRQQKIILNLKRELEKEKRGKLLRAGVTQKTHIKNANKSLIFKKKDKKILEKKPAVASIKPDYDEKLIKKDLFKTFLLSAFLLIIIAVLYLYSKTRILPSLKINLPLTKILEPFFRISLTRSQ